MLAEPVEKQDSSTFVKEAARGGRAPFSPERLLQGRSVGVAWASGAVRAAPGQRAEKAEEGRGQGNAPARHRVARAAGCASRAGCVRAGRGGHESMRRVCVGAQGWGHGGVCEAAAEAEVEWRRW